MITLPKKIYLAAMKKHWKISYIEAPGKLIIIEHPHRELALYGKNYSKLAALNLITRWVRLKSHIFLSELLRQLNRKVKVNYKKLIIRSHEAQWGSYSSTKTISLNYKLIFLPPALARHVIFHELCHVNNMDHSDKFWNTLAKYDRNWKTNRAALNDADDFIPEWVTY